MDWQGVIRRPAILGCLEENANPGAKPAVLTWPRLVYLKRTVCRAFSILERRLKT